MTFVVLTCFALLGVVTVGYGILLRKQGSSAMGTPTITPILFYSGKFSMFACWGLACYAAASGFGNIEPNAIMPMVGVTSILVGTAGSLATYVSLGSSTRMGLPTDRIELKTGGLFRFSRNPFYTSFLLLSFGAVLYSPGWLIAGCAIYGHAIHHQIILGEERFLAATFGSEWNTYAARVRRYL